MSPGRRGRDGIDEDLAQGMTKLYRLVRRFSRLEVDGLENVPEGKALLVANHTGWSGWDFANLYVTVRDELERDVYTAVHPHWFLLERIGELARRAGMYEAGVTESVRILDQGDLVLFFPEGEKGSFKPMNERYKLQPFEAGFARVASASMAPVVPATIVGGEETHPVLTRLEFTKELLGIGLPVPASLLPLPVKWRIRFLEPVEPGDYMTPEAADADPVEELRSDVERLMQDALEETVQARGNPFF